MEGSDTSLKAGLSKQLGTHNSDPRRPPPHSGPSQGHLCLFEAQVDSDFIWTSSICLHLCTTFFSFITIMFNSEPNKHLLCVQGTVELSPWAASLTEYRCTQLRWLSFKAAWELGCQDGHGSSGGDMTAGPLLRGVFSEWHLGQWT